MSELRINFTLPDEVGIGYSDLSKHTTKCLFDGIMRIQREFIDSSTENELGILYIAQSIEDSVFESLIQRKLSALYLKDLSDSKKEFGIIVSFLLSYHSMVDERGKLAKFKQDIILKHLKLKSIDKLADLYFNLLSKRDSEEPESLITELMTDIIIEKLDGKTSIETLNKFLSAEVQNDKLEKFVKEKFRIIRE